MKNVKKIIVLIMVLAFCATMFASCEDNEKIVATLNGKGYIYKDDTDFSDLYNLYIYYYKTEYAESEKDTSEYNLILREAVYSTFEMRFLEDEAAKRGLSVDMSNVAAEAYKDKQVFEEYYSGGFNTFCEQWGLSKEVFVTLNRYEALCELAKENFITVNDVKDGEAKEYYEKNKKDFIKTPHYEIKELFLQITDNSNKPVVYKDAQICIGALNAGRGWDFVLDLSGKKYNLEKGMVFSHYLTGTEIIEKGPMARNGNLNSLIEVAAENFKEKHGVYYEEMFPEGFDEYVESNEITLGSDVYRKLFEIHMAYCSEVYNIERNYAIMQQWETGKSYSVPIYHGGFNSYVVIYFSSVEDEEGEVPFEDAKQDIVDIITEDRIEAAYGDFIARKMNEVDIQIKYYN